MAYGTNRLLKDDPLMELAEDVAAVDGAPIDLVLAYLRHSADPDLIEDEDIEALAEELREGI